ncbi:MAG: hypothetical protein HN929_07135 [Chloroflexi bacterium]|jgi:hypothetical protein|nr:hypothetical protein [Chloroflexota bacterium]MBT7081221.1 hypothetical protein [Chloroflexota bacterium]
MSWFKRNKEKKPVPPTRVLVSAIGDDSELRTTADSDAEIYSKHYSQVTNKAVDNADALIDLISAEEFDIVHLLARVNADGTVGQTSIKNVIDICAKTNVKLLFFAHSNLPDTYIQNFKPGRFNLVMTINRKDKYFGGFLDALLGKLTLGKTMPTAWVELSPQTEQASEHNSLPECAFVANLPKHKFLRGDSEVAL